MAGLLLFVPTIIGTSILIFVLMRLIPGDVAHILVYESGTEYSKAAEKKVKGLAPGPSIYDNASYHGVWLDK